MRKLFAIAHIVLGGCNNPADATASNTGSDDDDNIPVASNAVDSVGMILNRIFYRLIYP